MEIARQFYFVCIYKINKTFRVGLELWGSRAIGEFSEAQAESIKSKRKVKYSKDSEKNLVVNVFRNELE